MTEFAFIAGFIACGAISALLVLGPRLLDFFTSVHTYLGQLPS